MNTRNGFVVLPMHKVVHCISVCVIMVKCAVYRMPRSWWRTSRTRYVTWWESWWKSIWKKRTKNNIWRLWRRLILIPSVFEESITNGAVRPIRNWKERHSTASCFASRAKHGTVCLCLIWKRRTWTTLRLTCSASMPNGADAWRKRTWWMTITACWRNSGFMRAVTWNVPLPCCSIPTQKSMWLERL